MTTSRDIKKSVTTNDIVQRIIEYITQHELSPGTRLPSIREFADEWQVPRSAVRDGLLRAESLGFVQLHPRAGAFVKAIDFQQIADMLSGLAHFGLAQSRPRLVYLLEVLEVLENAVWQRAVRRRVAEDLLVLAEHLQAMEKATSRQEFLEADRQFHLTISEISGNPVFTLFQDILLAMLQPDLLSFPITPELVTEVHRNHRAIYQMISDGKAEDIPALAERHIGIRRDVLFNTLAPHDDAS